MSAFVSRTASRMKLIPTKGAVVQVGQNRDRLAGERRRQIRDRDGVASDPDVGGLVEPVPGGEAGGPGQPEAGLEGSADERAAANHAGVPFGPGSGNG
ncbi:MAG: hypothetical protein JWP08_4564 [Bryobacterales bacterium]|nr:hypothetical protein [Bryobacterales bacterium]